MTDEKNITSENQTTPQPCAPEDLQRRVEALEKRIKGQQRVISILSITELILAIGALVTTNNLSNLSAELDLAKSQLSNVVDVLRTFLEALQ